MAHTITGNDSLSFLYHSIKLVTFENGMKTSTVIGILSGGINRRNFSTNFSVLVEFMNLPEEEPAQEGLRIYISHTLVIPEKVVRCLKVILFLFFVA